MVEMGVGRTPLPLLRLTGGLAAASAYRFRSLLARGCAAWLGAALVAVVIGLAVVRVPDGATTWR